MFGFGGLIGAWLFSQFNVGVEYGALLAIFYIIMIGAFMGVIITAWIYSVRASAQRGEWLWFAFIILQAWPGLLYYILDSAGLMESG